MKIFSYAIILLFIIFAIWAIFIEPYILKITKYVVENKDLSGMRIVFASDFHIKPYERGRLSKIISEINNQKPDLILLGGDYVSGHKPTMTMRSNKIAAELNNLKSKYGVYAVMGNHDGWQGKYQIIKDLEQNGITVLENANKDFGLFTVAGVEDIQTGNPNVEKALLGAGKNIILLTHNPDIFPQIPENVTLVLAGHLHGGQVNIPGRGNFIIPSKYGKKYLYGEVKEHNKTLFTSKGLGTSILPIRFNCPPEIVVIDFK